MLVKASHRPSRVHNDTTLTHPANFRSPISCTGVSSLSILKAFDFAVNLSKRRRLTLIWEEKAAPSLRLKTASADRYIWPVSRTIKRVFARPAFMVWLRHFARIHWNAFHFLIFAFPLPGCPGEQTVLWPAAASLATCFWPWFSLLLPIQSQGVRTPCFLATSCH